MKAKLVKEELISQEEYLKAKEIVNKYKEQQETKEWDPLKIPGLIDMHGEEIKPEQKIVYQRGTEFEATADVVKKPDGIWFINWSDGNEDLKASEFWYGPTDSRITEIVKEP